MVLSLLTSRICRALLLRNIFIWKKNELKKRKKEIRNEGKKNNFGIICDELLIKMHD